MSYLGTIPSSEVKIGRNIIVNGAVNVNQRSADTTTNDTFGHIALDFAI